MPVATSGASRRATKQEQREPRADREQTEKVADLLGRKLDDVDLVAMLVDGIESAKHAVTIALGVTTNFAPSFCSLQTPSTSLHPWVVTPNAIAMSAE
jgi:hypothetical protein